MFRTHLLKFPYAAVVRDSIWNVQPSNSCINCHKTQGHHESLTPQELRNDSK